MKYIKMNRAEKKADKHQRRADALQGEGLYVYQNTTKGDLFLPKPTASGKRMLAMNEQFQGDSYYKCLVGTGLKLIRTIVDPNAIDPNTVDITVEKEILMEENKLILDQPERVTRQGQTEHVVQNKPQTHKINEVNPQPQQKQPDVLINEDPMDGVEIILS